MVRICTARGFREMLAGAVIVAVAACLAPTDLIHLRGTMLHGLIGRYDDPEPTLTVWSPRDVVSGPQVTFEVTVVAPSSYSYAWDAVTFLDNGFPCDGGFAGVDEQGQ